jgi:uncharacterized membrane protein YcaP (DUF421 family)
VYFDDWASIGRVFGVGVVAYGALVLVLRLSGKRTLAKMNAFDFVVTVALGSALSTILLSPDIALAEGVAAIALLCGAQYVVAWLSTRTVLVRRMVKSRSVLVLRDGRFIDAALRRERLTPSEVRQAIRAGGNGAVEDIAAVVLETDGTLSVIPGAAVGSGSALCDVDGRSAEVHRR